MRNEEQRDSDGVQIVTQKYTKLFKFLFGKYAMTRTQTRKVENFDFYSDKTISQSELSKLLQDHDVKQLQLGKFAMIDLHRSVNLAFARKNDLSDLSYELFVHFLVQLSLHLFNSMAP